MEKNQTEKKSDSLLEDFFNQLTCSPTPIPRKKLIYQINTESLDETIDDSSGLSNETSSQTNRTNKILNKTVMTEIINFSSTENIFNPSNIFVTSTMPLPRKPRKAQLINSEQTSLDTQESVESINKNQICFLNSSYALSNYSNKFLDPTCSTQFLLNEIQESSSENYCLVSEKDQNETKTLKIERFKLKRPPTAPPPPPPFKSTNSFLLELSTNHNLYNVPDLNNKTNSYLNSTNVSSSSDITTTNVSSLSSVYTPVKNVLSNNNEKLDYLKNIDSQRKFIGFERIVADINFNKMNNNNNNNNKRNSIYLKSKQKLFLYKIFNFIYKKYLILESKNKNLFFDLIVFFIGFVLFLLCILSISLFQTQANEFYRKFLNKNNNNSLAQIKYSNNSIFQNSSSDINDDEYYNAGSDLVKQTILLCNGPYFSYQINNLIVLPFSLTLAIVFSFFSKRESTCFKSSSKLASCGKRPGLPSSINPFQRRNRFLVAALFCILANEIFKMIESSMFDASSNKESFNSTSDFLNSILNVNINSNKTSQSFNISHSNTDLLRIGLGIEPSLVQNRFTKMSKTSKKTTKSTKPFYLIAPSVLKYSKPKLRLRLDFNDFQTTTTTTTTTNKLSYTIGNLFEYSPNNVDGKLTDIKLNINIDESVNKYKITKNKSVEIFNSLNETLNESSNQTLFEFSMSIYQNKYVQGLFKKVFESREFKWSIIIDKCEKIGFMLVEVLIIGMRYYPLMDVLDKNSLVCLFLASIYMWADILYNITITGLCEGLKLNVSFDLLRDIRRIFGVGFIYDAKEYFKLDSGAKILKNGYSNNLFDSKDQMPVDAKLLFSTNRIFYTIIKSLPHFFCLSYVTIRLSATFIRKVGKKIMSKNENKFRNDNNERNVYDYEYFNQNYIVSSSQNFDIIYKKIGINSNLKKKSKSDWLSFEDRYVKNLLEKAYKNSSNKLVNLIYDENFRFSTRIVCTYTVCFTVLYYLTCFLIFYGSVFIEMIYLPSIYKDTIILTTFLTSFICLLQLILSMNKFKLHLTLLYKGKSEQYLSPKEFFSNKKIATSSFNYAGYVVTYTCWGYVILFFLLTFISFQIATLIEFDNTTIGVCLLIILIPFIISVLIFKIINRFIGSFAAKYCFLQKRSRVLALKNFKFYSIFLYFKFFYDCFTGLAFCFVRMIKSIVLCIIFLPRVDYSFMGRTLENMDPAFMSYIGYLYWESHHTNPILISFCDMLIRCMKKKKRKLEIKSEQFKRVRNKWHLILCLNKNPNLIKYRKNILKVFD